LERDPSSLRPSDGQGRRRVSWARAILRRRPKIQQYRSRQQPTEVGADERRRRQREHRSAAAVKQAHSLGWSALSRNWLIVMICRTRSGQSAHPAVSRGPCSIQPRRRTQSWSVPASPGKEPV